MNDQLAFVGDIHGHRDALECILHQIRQRKIPKAILLGDYINKGPYSKEVLDLIIAWEHNELELVPLLGNHEEALLETLKSGDIRPLLKLGGAPTIRSYAGEAVGPHVFAEFSAAFPERHRRFLSSLKKTFSNNILTAAHKPTRVCPKYRISAHTYIGRTPKIDVHSAEVDTGCGSGGLLTAFLWPSRSYIQCSEDGKISTVPQSRIIFN